MVSSTESAMTSRDTSEDFMPWWPMAMPSVTVMVQNSRRAAGFVDAALGGLRLAHQRDIAGCGLVPAGHNAHERAMDLLLLETHGVVVGAMRRARRPLGHMPARKLGFVERLGVHAEITFLRARGPNSRIEVLGASHAELIAPLQQGLFALRPPGHSARFPLVCGCWKLPPFCGSIEAVAGSIVARSPHIPEESRSRNFRALALN